MKKNLHSLTALLLLGALAPRGEGEGTTTPPVTTTGTEGRLTEAEYEARVRTREAQTSHTELIRRLAQLERQNADLQAAQVPRGGRALSSAEARQFEAYVALGTPEEVQGRLTERDAYAAHGTPEEVTRKITAGDQAQATLTQREKQDAIRALAGAPSVNFKEKVLADRLASDNLEALPLEKALRDGKEVEVAYVKDAQGTKHELTEYAKQHWGDYLPALQNAAQATTTTTTFTRQDATATTGGGGSWVKNAIQAGGQGGEYKDPLQHQKT